MKFLSATRWSLALVALAFLATPVLAQTKKKYSLEIDHETAGVVKKVSPAVVSIYVIPNSQKTVVPNRRTIYGAGVIIDPRGFILTNLKLVNVSNHKVICFLTDGRPHRAKVVGKLTKYDTALLKISGSKQYKAVKLGTSKNIRPGLLSMKFGNAFQTAKDYTPSVNLGTISGVDNVPYMGKLLRTDAAVNRGDDGGPLVNMEGELIGVLLPIWVHPYTNTYVNYAVPIDIIKKNLKAMMTGYVGILMTVSNQGTNGALIEEVDPDGPAKKAGLQKGDRVVGFGGLKVKNSQELVDLLKKFTVGDEIEVIVSRNGRLWKTKLALSARPE